MTNSAVDRFDILVAGAGFAGSLTALILSQTGFKVCVVEKGKHPRFAIGESSTPVADMILRKLSQTYNLPWLYDFSRYGSWQQAHPEIACGIKRGFSFYKHYPGKNFYPGENHANELLVAASADDVQSDTNWFRADFDAFLAHKVSEAGIVYLDGTEIVSAKRNAHWNVSLSQYDGILNVEADFIVDATGGGALAERLFGVESSAEGFLTNSFAIFSHFDNAPRWMDMLHNVGIPAAGYPYDPDHSALHHVLDEGWLWMLRFNNNRTSLGFALDGENEAWQNASKTQIWELLLQKYPSVAGIFKDAVPAPQPGVILSSGRLQRRLSRCYGEGWAVLPHTAGFIDPLFSSGIAHSLTGVETLVQLLKEYWDSPALYEQLPAYETQVFEELKFADQLISGCYKTMRHFELFNTWSMLYFIPVIACEQRRMHNTGSGYFLNAHDPAIRQMVDRSYRELLQLLEGGEPSAASISRFRETVRERIRPWNIAGLLEPEAGNMYRHTAAVL